MKTLKKATALFLSLTVAAGVLAGCGSTTDQEADTATPETSTTTPAQDTQTAESNVDKALALINTFATATRRPPPSSWTRLHPTQLGLRHRGGCLPGLGRGPGRR
ncbi:MAG: hypothetical protein ACLR6W_05850 [Evtepia sp.]